MRRFNVLGMRLGQRGTTLVEMLVVMGLMAIFLSILATLFTSTADVQGRANSYAAVSAEGRFLMSRLNYDIARATSISIPGTLGGTTANMRLVVSGTTYNYRLSGTDFQLNDGPGYVNLNGNQVQVSAVSFRRLGVTGRRESIKYSFTLTSVDQTRNGPDTQTFTATVQRR